ncbi:MAG: thiamine-phosphate kinase [Bifidobacteriaceae bacterium]|nr:thiamine-phosphate kinase [Bifidobacteriaceae bacterium]
MDEDALIAALTRDLPPGEGALLGPGDDSAVLALADGRATISTDILVEGVHFRSAWSAGFDVGWRLAAQNLADAATMGAVPRWLVVAVAGPPAALGGEWGADFARGLGAYCRRWRVGVVGGDLSSAPVLVASGTVVGDLEGREPVTRFGARPGDVLAVSDAVATPPGSTPVWALGGSAAGLAWLAAKGEESERIAEEVLAKAAVAAYLRPDPPLDLGKRAALGRATAMIDISDGLAKDAGRLAKASGVRAAVDPSSPALAGSMARWAPLARALGADQRDWVLAGGEDHAFLATFPAGAGLPGGWHGIGKVSEPGPNGPGVEIAGWNPQTAGWDHFA